MAFAFTQRRAIEQQVRDIASEQIDKALDAGKRGEADFAALVHQLRRRCKKLRGLLRLIEPHFKHARRENRAFRDAAAGLSGTRDAAVMVETLADILDFDRQHDGGARIDAARGEALAAEFSAKAGEVPDQQGASGLLRHFIETFEAARRRVDDWELSGRGFDQLGDGLEDTYRRMRNGLAVAETEQTAEAVHEWRKDAKYHWQHVALLQSAAPEVLKPRKALLDRLGEILGDHHNLAVLDHKLAELPDVSAIRGVIAERQATLASEAFVLGHQLTAEKPGMLRDRFEQYWSLLPERS